MGTQRELPASTLAYLLIAIVLVSFMQPFLGTLFHSGFPGILALSIFLPPPLGVPWDTDGRAATESIWGSTGAGLLTVC